VDARGTGRSPLVFDEHRKGSTIDCGPGNEETLELAMAAFKMAWERKP
jgi:hypothetical protein